MGNKEIEVKFKVNVLDQMAEKIKKAGGKGGEEFFQKTIRLDTPNDDLEKRGVFLRVRKEIADTMTVKIKNRKNENFFERDE
jgi:inorganic triphosphatase YgiF